jgi:hypothetical protein
MVIDISFAYNCNKKNSHSQDQRHHKYIELDIEIPHPIRSGQYEGRPKDF